MVAISKSISTKIKEKQGDITDDEVCVCIHVYVGNYCTYAFISLTQF